MLGFQDGQCSSNEHTAHVHYMDTLKENVLLINSYFGTPAFNPGIQLGSCYSIFSFMCMFCRLLFVLLSFFFWPLCCLSFFDLRVLFTPLVSSNSSLNLTVRYYGCVYVDSSSILFAIIGNCVHCNITFKSIFIFKYYF